jgi:hypothetical protein
MQPPRASSMQRLFVAMVALAVASDGLMVWFSGPLPLGPRGLATALAAAACGLVVGLYLLEQISRRRAVTDLGILAVAMFASHTSLFLWGEFWWVYAVGLALLISSLPFLCLAFMEWKARGRATQRIRGA